MGLRLVKQLDGSAQQGANCGPVSTAHAVAWSTRGRLTPTPTQVRKEMGGTWSGPGLATSLADNQRAFDSYRDDARRRRLRLGTYTRRLMSPWDGAMAALDDGGALVIQTDYDWLNREKPRWSGDRNFRGLHVIFVPRKRERDGRTDMLVYDGLFDGRTAVIPRGPQWVPASIIRNAAESRVVRALVGEGMTPERARRAADGLATYAVVTRSTDIVPKPPDPGPEPATCDDLLDAANARIEALELALGTARTALVNAGDGIADALADIDEAMPAETDPEAHPGDGVGSET